MRSEEYKQIYDKVSLSKEADERILEELLREKEDVIMMRGKRRKWITGTAVATVAVAAFVVGVARIPAVGSAAGDVISRFTNLIVINSASIDEIGDEVSQAEGREYGYPISIYKYSDSGEYLHVNSDAPKKECRMASVSEVSQALGVDLLQSKDAYEAKDSILYTPYVSDSGALNGVILKNDFYALGDIRDAEFNVSGDLKTEGGYISVSYREGENYHSPIMMELTIRTDDNEGVDEENHELDYGGRQLEADEGAIIRSEMYEIENLGVTALLTVDDTPGSYSWNKLDGDEINSAVDAYFVYQGVEYRYVGAVSTETMKEFLETLEIPDKK